MTTFKDALRKYFHSRRMVNGVWVLDDALYMEPLVKACGRNFQAKTFLWMGGEAILLHVRDVFIQIDRVLKFPRPDIPELGLKRFIRGARTLATLESSYFPTVLQLSLNPFFLCLDWTKGRTLREWCFTEDYYGEGVIDYFREMLKAIDLLHKNGITHRDIRPDNIIITPKGRVKIIDFGLCKKGENKNYTIVGETLGNEFYSPPEQLENAVAVDNPTADVYSLAQTFYFLITKQEERLGEHKPEIFLKYNLSPAVMEFYAKAISADPNNRYSSAGAMLEAYNVIFPPSVLENTAKTDNLYSIIEEQMVILGSESHLAEMFCNSFISARKLRRMWRKVSEERAKQCISE